MFKSNSPAQQGAIAYRQGFKLTQNPYSGKARKQWAQGWLTEHQKNVLEVQSGRAAPNINS